MKFNPIFKNLIHCSNSEEVFSYFKNTLTDSITPWTYYVNWQKVIANFRKIEISLNILNTLIGKNNLEQELKYLLNNYPEIFSVIPILIACRTSNFQILTNYLNGNFQYKNYNFSKQIKSLSLQEIDEAVEFMKETGVLDLFSNRTIKSIPDYVLGIEVGLDTNGRKNRGGSSMEMITEQIVSNICTQNNFFYLKQATAEKIISNWGIFVKVDKSSRIFDFAINNQGMLYLIEVNFYGGGGSKLKSTAGEYRNLFDFISAQNHKLIWVTDGLGWKTTLKPLEETFNYIDYTFNLNMVNSGLLAEVIKQQI
ncbi:type II restriction endonuclease [Calothrix sp. UHCC 0171]|uniref:type II restriction endonuclease n=1 Tax=Calothrix sp. UHCC 0171 TaxID=3110245 RepID=UPI002B206EF0|nr:type II restriction endonuclease [Calothrix sp. UHCC 0171]MEA5570057.1 type II restriction endonuclease [Calothrix sp. UHCC 0171]